MRFRPILGWAGSVMYKNGHLINSQLAGNDSMPVQVHDHTVGCWNVRNKIMNL